MRRDGSSLAVIAKALGYADEGGAWAAIKAGLRKSLQEPCEEFRQLELERLDVLWEKWRLKAENSDPDAVNVLLKISRQRCSLLGLDAPKRLEATVKGAFTFASLLEVALDASEKPAADAGDD